MEYMKQINALRDKPEFYNTLTTNCTTAIWHNTLVNAEHLPFSWKILASGYVPDYLYQAGRLDTSVPFAELKRRAHVNCPGAGCRCGSGRLPTHPRGIAHRDVSDSIARCGGKTL
jgi:hypothetical protein